MSTYIVSVLTGIRKALCTAQRKWLFLAVTLSSLAVLFSVPVFSIPSNSFAFQISITRWSDVALLLTLSVMIGFVAVLQLEWRRCCGTCESKVASAVKGGSSVFVALTGGLFAAASCSSCIVGILGLIGVSTSVALTLLDYHWYIVWGSLLITATFVTLTARKIARNSCHVSSCT